MTQTLDYRILTLDDVIDVARPFLPGVIDAEEVGNGNVNVVYRAVSDDGASVIVKQALPYLRLVGESWPLSIDRARIEAEALELANRFAPGLAPVLHHHDQTLALLVMEDLRGYSIWRDALMRCEPTPGAARAVGEFAARMFHATSDLGMEPAERKRLAARFVNPDLCAITERLVFTAPFVDDPSNGFDPALQGEAESIWSDRQLAARVAELRFKYRTQAQSLIHADLHTGSVMVGPGGAKVIDPEFSFYGPVAYDIGVPLGNLLISWIAHRAQNNGAYADGLGRQARELWDAFAGELRQLWPANEPWFDRFVADVLADAASFAGMKLVRRVLGLAHAPDIDEIEDEPQRVSAQLAALRIGRALIRTTTVGTVDEIWTLAAAFIE